MADNALVTDRGGSAGLPVELADAFTSMDGAWEQWTQQTNEVRQTYARWVAEPIFAAVLMWLVVAFVVGSGGLLLDKVLNEPYVWMDLLNAASLSAMLTFGSTAGRVWL
jgi:hypothetical protein